MADEYVMLEADMEYAAESFWSEFREKFPKIAQAITDKGWAIVRMSKFREIVDIPGFSDGPAHARDALVPSQSHDIADRCRKYVLELVEWEETNGYSTTELVKECINCQEAYVDESGDIQISGHQNSCWLNHDGLLKFVGWHQETA